jgi:hypothetical protein
MSRYGLPMRSTRYFAAITALASLVACGAMDGGSTNLPQGRCRAAGAAAMLGQPMNDMNVEEARYLSGAARFRTVPYRSTPPGGSVDPLRLNIEVDEKGVIQRLSCG